MFFSSFIFVFNIIYAYMKNDIIYCYIFCILLITSLLYHYYQNNILLFIDKLTIIAVVLFGLYRILEKITIVNTFIDYVILFIIIITFVIVNYLYNYGCYTQQYCFCKNKYAADICHSILHMFVSIGHNCIIFL